MTKETENGPAVPLDLTPSSITVPTSVTSSPITVKVTPFEKEPLEIDYDPSTPSGEIVTDSLNASGTNLEQAEVEVITETLERSRNIFDRGFQFAFNLAGKAGLEINLPPKSEIKTTKNVKYTTSKK